MKYFLFNVLVSLGIGVASSCHLLRRQGILLEFVPYSAFCEVLKFSKNSHRMLPVEFFQTPESTQVLCSYTVLIRKKEVIEKCQ